MKRTLSIASSSTLFLVIAMTIIFSGCGGNSTKKLDMTQEFKDFIKTYEAKVTPLFKEMNLANFKAAVSGKPEDYKIATDLRIKVTKIYTNKDDFAKLKKFKESNSITDELLKRQLEILYNSYLSNQIDDKKLEEMIKLQSKIEEEFNTFRADVNGKKLTDNEIEEILRNSKKSDELKAAWMGTKKSGEVVSADVIKIVKLRNEIAKELGFNNYHEMSLKLSDQDPKEIEKLFDELDNLTKDEFAKLKGEMDDYFAKRYNIKKEELMPWHYQNRFFQEAPQIYPADIDTYYKGKDLVDLTTKYYNGVGLEIADMVKKSDLFEKPGKNQHAFCQDIDNEGDVRV
ncbi:MAG: M2 family metallopeptidase, partial [Bacteroidetes bacterium]|nr:M2 family metallopeptidase [Bacteroidota bacterium]